VGKHIANNLLFIYMAMVLWACTIEPAKDENGHVILIDVDGCVEDAVVVRPVLFKVDISPHFPEATALLADERELRGH